MDGKKEFVERIREFNRFYTVLIGSLNVHFLDSEYSVTETKILFELIANKECNAKSIAKNLHIDKSYMSRIIKSFEKKELIMKCVSEVDHREHIIRLTNKGKEEVTSLINMTNMQIGALISDLNMEECKKMCMAMDLITDYLSRNNNERKEKNE